MASNFSSVQRKGKCPIHKAQSNFKIDSLKIKGKSKKR